VIFRRFLQENRHSDKTPREAGKNDEEGRKSGEEILKSLSRFFRLYILFSAFSS